MSSHDDEKEEKPEGITDIIKRIVSVGVGSAFMTDETIRKSLADLPLPKDIVNGLLQNARQAKTDFLETFRDEIKNQMGRVDPSRLVDELVERYDIEVKAHVSFKKKETKAEDGGTEPKTKKTPKSKKSSGKNKS